ncbi:MAG: hypothetical protein ACI9WV_002266 [Patiriisocius sp.]|jgi:hypothetical protein
MKRHLELDSDAEIRYFEEEKETRKKKQECKSLSSF